MQSITVCSICYRGSPSTKSSWIMRSMVFCKCSSCTVCPPAPPHEGEDNPSAPPCTRCNPSIPTPCTGLISPTDLIREALAWWEDIDDDDFVDGELEGRFVRFPLVVALRLGFDVLRNEDNNGHKAVGGPFLVIMYGLLSSRYWTAVSLYNILYMTKPSNTGMGSR